MDQNSGSQNKTTEFILKNQITIIVVALIAILAIVYFVTRGSDSRNDQADKQDQETGQNSGQNSGQPGQIPAPAPTPAPAAAQPDQGNVMASGTLRASDNAAKGNYMVDSDQGKVYISTRRDFESLVGESVTLNANGTLNNFVFLGFNDSAEVTDTTAMGGDGMTAGAVAYNGILRKSDQPQVSNYMVTSGSTAVYYSSARNYDAWLGSNVHLVADGSLDSFTNGVLHKR